MSWVEAKTIVVTGGSSGIGKGIAFALAERGGRVVLAGRTPSRVETAVAQIRQAGGEAIGVPADVGDPVAVERLMSEAEAAFGHVDGLVTAAGVGRVHGLLEQSDAEIEEEIRTDLLGTIHAIRAGARRMPAGSQVVTIASSVAGGPSATMPLYAAVKTAVVVLSNGIRGELADLGIRLTCLLPGAVATNFQLGWGERELGAFGMAGHGEPEPHWNAHPDLPQEAPPAEGRDLRRVMRARDIAPAVLFAFDLPPRSRGATLEVV
jgi:NAD(P)-dependent dehydrogenase (short-subunit alcohol dehydrogenase family)